MDNTATLRFIVFDLLNDLKQVIDSAELTPFKILYWVLIHADRLKKEHIKKIDSGAYTTRFDVVIELDPVTGRNYFTLPAAIYDYDEDNGIVYMCYPPEIDLSIPGFAAGKFNRTAPDKAARLYFRDDERPSPSNPYYYRLQDRVYILGVEQINILKLEVGLKVAFGPVDTTIDIDAPFDFPQDLLPILKRQILDLGRVVLMIPTDLVNGEASFDSKAMPTEKLTSVEPANPNNPQNVQ